jgi:hypothetical protein
VTPSGLGVAGEADYGARPDPVAAALSLRAGGELEAVTADLDGFTVGQHRLH